VATFNEGKVFGELGILNKKLRAATITSVESAYLAVLSLDNYKKILLDYD
jgi:CRP-like cAMP-binding protein